MKTQNVVHSSFLKTAVIFFVILSFSCEVEEIENTEPLNVNSSIELEESSLVAVETNCDNPKVEDFEEGADISSWIVFASPLNQYTDNDAFNPGDIIPGLTITSSDPNYRDLGYMPGYSYAFPEKVITRGMTSTGQMIEWLILQFDSDVLNSVELVIHFYNNNCCSSLEEIVVINVEGMNGIIHSEEITANIGGVSWNISTEEPVKSISLKSKYSNGNVGVGYVAFTNCQQPIDGDNDGINDEVDNCPILSNPDQADLDGDGIGDVCDFDADGDGVNVVFDNCPLIPNPDQRDTDSDDKGDVCDEDDDNDGVLDAVDNCPLNSNSTQEDYDGDGAGDVCDEDDDNDGFLDDSDSTPLSNMEDTIIIGTCDSGVNNIPVGGGDMLADEIDRFENTEYKNNGQRRKATAQLTESLLERGLITEEEKNTLLSCAGTGL